MIGVGFRVMKFTKISKSYSALFATCVFIGGAHAASESSAVLTINATFNAPTCVVDVQPTYNLGVLKLGEMRDHPSFKVNWSCEGDVAVDTALSATLLKGNTGSSLSRIKMIGENNHENGTILYIKEESSGEIKFTGKESDSFCAISRVTSGGCDLTPVTIVNSGDTPGAVMAAIQFSVVYK